MPLLPRALGSTQVAAAVGRGGTANTAGITVLAFLRSFCSPSVLPRNFRWGNILISTELQ